MNKAKLNGSKLDLSYLQNGTKIPKINKKFNPNLKHLSRRWCDNNKVQKKASSVSSDFFRG